MELIDKAAIVAEIERLRKHETQWQENHRFSNYRHGLCDCYKNILSFLDTLETKDVDLDEEIDKWYDTAPDEFEKIHFEHIENCARHFFELGLKAKEE